MGVTLVCRSSDACCRPLPEGAPGGSPGEVGPGETGDPGSSGLEESTDEDSILCGSPHKDHDGVETGCGEETG